MNLIKLDLVSDVSLSPDSEKEKNRLLQEASSVTEVSNPDQQQIAVRWGKQIKQHLNEVEDARKQVKEPVLELGRKIDGIAKDYVASLTVEMERLRKLVAGYQDKEAKRLLEEQRKRNEELRKAEEDRLAAVKLAEEAAARATAEEASFKEAEEAMLADALKQETETKTQELLKAPEPTIQKAKGMSVKSFDLKYEITDIKALQVVRPDLVALEPNKSAIRDCLHVLWVNQQAGNPTPGITVRQEASVSFRG